MTASVPRFPASFCWKFIPTPSSLLDEALIVPELVIVGAKALSALIPYCPADEIIPELTRVTPVPFLIVIGALPLPLIIFPEFVIVFVPLIPSKNKAEFVVASKVPELVSVISCPLAFTCVPCQI